MSNPLPLTYTEIANWRDLKPDVFLTGRTVDLIIRTDAAFRRVWSEWHKRKDEFDGRGD